jgi:SARP family transcriptional regulator, regulator of embCAB operon
LEELRVLGPIEVRTHTGLVQVGEPRRLAVLAALTIDAGRVVSTTTLIDRVWGDDPPGQATKTLGTYIARIRRVLGESFREAPVTVVSQPGGYRLTAQRDQVDLFRFRDLVSQAREPDCSRQKRVDLLRQAVSLHRGDPLTGVNGAWATRTREHLTGELLTAQAEWAEAELAAGDAAAVLAPLSVLTDTNPLVEPLVVALVRALVVVGRPTEALERCRMHRQRLADDYGTDPSPQLMALYESILRADRPPTARRPELPERAAAPEATVSPGANGGVPAPGAAETVPGRPRRFGHRHVALAVSTALAVALGAVALLHLPGLSGETHFSATEDFSGTALDPAQWVAHETRQENGSSWSKSAVRVSGGELQIRGTGRNPNGSGNMAGSVCWCWERGVTRTFGVWEVRAKFDVGRGFAPIIGLYPDADEHVEGWGFLTLARVDDGDRRTMYPVLGGAGGRPIKGVPVAGELTAWNTYAIEWRADFVTVSLNGTVVFDSRKLPGPMAIPTVPMYLYVQVIPGPEGPVPAPNAETPTNVTAHVDWARYTS